MNNWWTHRPECTHRECYCADPEFPDPVCECGRPGWACNCVFTIDGNEEDFDYDPDEEIHDYSPIMDDPN